MTEDPVLCPTGTATELWRHSRTGSCSYGAEWNSALIKQLATSDYPPDLVAIAGELASLAAPRLQPAIQLLMLVVLRDLRDGATLTPITTDISDKLHQLAPMNIQGRQVVQDALSLLQSPENGVPILSKTPEQPAPLLIHQNHLQLFRLHALEHQLSTQILRLVDASPAMAPMEITQSTLKVNSQPLSDEQLAAIRAAAQQSFTVIAGGPGTGKTSIALAFINLLLKHGLPLEGIVLSAPTGKATRRLAEAIEYMGASPNRLRIQTLHRLLGATPGRSQFTHNRDHPLPAQLIIVDEASLLDLELTAGLIDAVTPGSRVILLGDDEQIPSGDPGSVLSDLTKALPSGVIHRLKNNFRMKPKKPAGRQVWLAAQAIQRGDSKAFFELANHPPLPSGVQPLQFIELNSTRALPAYLRQTLLQSPLGQQDFQKSVRATYQWTDGAFPRKQAATIESLFQKVQAHQLLTITRNPYFATGSDAINDRLHALYAQQMNWPGSQRFLPGEPVIVLQNDYQRQIYNGDIGIVLSIAFGHQPTESMAVFPNENGWLVFELDTLRGHISLAHAMTVHKAQGSEYSQISLLLPHTDMPLLTREIIYTAVTRACDKVHVVGTTDVFTHGLHRQGARHSGLPQLLRPKV